MEEKVYEVYEEVKEIIEYFIEKFIKKFNNVKVKTTDDNKIIISTKLPKIINDAVIRVKYYENKTRTFIDIWDKENPFTLEIDMEEKILITAKNIRKVSTDYDDDLDCTVIYISATISRIKVIIDLNAFEYMQPFIFLVFS